jgi:hypothetical protein
MITQDYLKSILHYCPDTGVFTWIVNKGPVKAGSIASCILTDGKGIPYLSVMINGKTYLQHRLAWLYCFGYMPKDMVDHINGDTVDNRIRNLREASNSKNCKNQKRRTNNTSGVTGVYWVKVCGKWGARINSDYKSINLGVFNSFEDAVAARKAKEIELGYHKNHDRTQ